MALRQLLIARRLTELRSEKSELEKKIGEIEARRSAWSEREAKAEVALAEITDETGAEERSVFDAECAEIEKEDAEIRAEEEAAEKRGGEIDTEIASLEAEAESINQRTESARREKPSAPVNKNNTKGGVEVMNYAADERGRVAMELREMVKNDEVRNFIVNLRNRAQNRGVTNAVYTVPTLMIPLIYSAVDRHSKLKKHVRVKKLKGDGKMNIVADAPEAVWTSNTGKLNELAVTINQVESSANKIAGYLPVENPYLEDSDEDLAGIIVDQLGQSVGYATDKSIGYGTGTNMPIGILTRLAATSQPSWWQAKMPAFTDLHSTHLGALSASTVHGTNLYKEAVGVLGLAQPKYEGGEGDYFWALNQATWLKLVTELIGVNAAGALVTGAQKVMPIIGGAVEILDFMPANVIAGGDGSQYLWTDRKEIQIDMSEHVLFLDDCTVFRVRARADGIPVAGEGFAAFSLSTTAPTAAMTFAPDTANTVSDSSDSSDSGT